MKCLCARRELSLRARLVVGVRSQDQRPLAHADAQEGRPRQLRARQDHTEEVQER